jgi:hypothetical protein
VQSNAELDRGAFRRHRDVAHRRRGRVLRRISGERRGAHRRLLRSRTRIPVVSGLATFAERGNLITHGPEFTDVYRRLAGYVDRIYKGAKPGDLPIEQPTKFELVINQKTAKAIGLTIPQLLLLRADKVIQ